MGNLRELDPSIHEQNKIRGTVTNLLVITWSKREDKGRSEIGSFSGCSSVSIQKFIALPDEPMFRSEDQHAKWLFRVLAM